MLWRIEKAASFMTVVGESRQPASLVLGIAFMMFLPCVALAEEDEAVLDRERIIEQIEDNLSTAYSFDADSPYKLPHYEVLDRIFPQWHRGEPAVARQMWLTLGFAAHVVLYRVDYVFLANRTTALVSGKRLVVWTRDPEASIVGKGLWPFQMWSNLTKYENSSCVKCVDVTYAVRYRMKLKKNEAGEWIIEEERLLDSPNIPHELENSCTMKKQLQDWGFEDICTGGGGKGTLF